MRGHLELAVEHHRAGRLGEAETACREVLVRDPHNADAYNDLGRALELLGRPSDARAMYQQALALDPQHAKAHFNLGLVSLLLNDHATGWREFEWRLRIPETADPAMNSSSNLPRWDGSDPAGRTILVHGEKGLGDCIQFARYLPLLSGRGADVVVTCPPALVRLFGNIRGVCVVADGDPAPRADACVAIGSLPLMFETTSATIPTFGAYLRPPAHAVAAWRQRMRPLRQDGRRLVGLVWAGGPAGADHRPRSVRLADLAPLAAAASSVRFVSLQSGPAAGQTADAAAARMAITNLSPHLHDLAETAAAIHHLDLVIAVDTAVAHLAGAVGKPVWTLLPFAGEWPWLTTGDSTGWYPSMRLFRQPARGDWASAITELAQELRAQYPAARPTPLAA